MLCVLPLRKYIRYTWFLLIIKGLRRGKLHLDSRLPLQLCLSVLRAVDAVGKLDVKALRVCEMGILNSWKDYYSSRH